MKRSAVWPLRWPGGVFWRTFFLIAILIAISLAAWFQSFRVIERTPRAQQIAQTIISVMNVTQSALIYADAQRRSALLQDLASNESIRIFPLEATDRITPLADTPEMHLIEQKVRERLGKGTRMAQNVNGQDGLWVSFSIEDDDYWVAFERDRVQAVPGLQWLRWGGVALVLSLAGALFISSLINSPLQRLTATAVAIGRGLFPPPLPEVGPREIREANASVNAMVADLHRIESDRVLLLAGISHDLRTPLTRLRLESEMSGAPEPTRLAMNHDIEQMDAIIGQFLDYARPLDSREGFANIDLGAVIRTAVEQRAPSADLHIKLLIDSTRPILAHVVEIKRLLQNLLENARRYAKTPGQEHAEVTVEVFDEVFKQGGVVLEVSDHGPGVPEQDLERLKHPFTRLDNARGQANGAGLGLAIVERIAQRHGARFTIENGDTNGKKRGLVTRIRFPAAA